MPAKLLHVNDVVYAYAAGDPSANGGAQRYAWLLARALAGAGWSVVVGVQQRLQPGERVRIEGVEFVGLDRCHPSLSWYRALAREKPDWWLWQCADHWWGPAVEIAKRAGVRTVFSSMHDHDIHPRTALVRHPRLWPAYAWGLIRTDRIVVQHEDQLAQLRPRWRSKASILPGIVTVRTAVRAHAERAPCIAWVGVLRRHKRPDLLIELARAMRATRFVVCGGPTTFNTAPGYSERILADLRSLPNVEYLGQVDPSRTLQIIADAALLLSTSDDEGLPSVFLEAWAAGTPVVSLTVDPGRVIRRLGLGSVPGTLERAKTAVEALLRSPSLRDAIATRATTHIGTAHSEAAAVQAFEASTLGTCAAFGRVAPTRA